MEGEREMYDEKENKSFLLSKDKTKLFHVLPCSKVKQKQKCIPSKGKKAKNKKMMVLSRWRLFQQFQNVFVDDERNGRSRYIFQQISGQSPVKTSETLESAKMKDEEFI